MQLRTQYLLLVFVFGVIAKGITKSTFGSNMSNLLLLCVAIYYWCIKRHEKCVYDEIAIQQAKDAAELYASQGVGDGKVTEISLAMRRTSFKLNMSDKGVITDRIRQYSSKFGGSRKDRQKFLRKNSKTNPVKIDVNNRDLKALSMIETSKHETNRTCKGKTEIESIVEEAVDATL